MKLIFMSGYKSILKVRLFFISCNYIFNDLFIFKIFFLFIEVIFLFFCLIDNVF